LEFNESYFDAARAKSDDIFLICSYNLGSFSKTSVSILG